MITRRVFTIFMVIGLLAAACGSAEDPRGDVDDAAGARHVTRVPTRTVQ